MSPKTIALVSLLEARMRDGTWPPLGRLPSVRELARSLSVSRKAVNASLMHLATVGTIEQSSRDRRYYVRGRKDWYQGKSIPGYRVSEIARTLAAEIMRSTPADVSRIVPSVKNLEARFGCSRETVTKALAVLCGRGLLVKRGRTYSRASPRVTPQSRSRIAVGRPTDAVLDGDPIFPPILRGIESECRLSGWPPPVHFVDDGTVAAPQQLPKSCTGLIYVKGTGPWESYVTLKRSLPVVVVEVGELLGWVRLFGRRENLFAVCPDNVRAGCEMGRHLAAQGHERIAYFSHMAPAKGWWKLRMEGLAGVFSDSDGQAGSRCLFTFVGPASDQDLTVGRRDAADFDAAIQEAARQLEDMDRGLVRGALNSANTVGRIRKIAGFMRPFFERALRDLSVTAWVCVNDLCAAAAIHFLRIRGVDRRVVVTGFDNSSIALQLQFTSFDFCYDQIGRMATQCIIRPEVFGGQRLKLIRVPGVVVDRHGWGRHKGP